ASVAPRGDINHLYVCTTRASIPSTLSGNHPTAWLPSITTKASMSLLAATTAGRSRTVPVDDCTAITATTSTPGLIAETSSSPGTATSSTPRSSCTIHGNTFEVNSTSSVSTFAPSGSAFAIGATAPETVPPTNTSVASAPTNRAND